MRMEDIVALVIAGLAASTVFHLLVLPLLPPRIREAASRWDMQLRRHALPPTVGMEMVSRASAPGGRLETTGRVREQAAAHMRSAGLDIAGSGASLVARIKVGEQTMGLSVRFASGDDDAFEQAEIVVEAECRYRDFESCVVEMREAQRKAKDVLSRAGMTLDKTFCVACRLESLPQAKAMLSSIDADVMSYSTPDGQKFGLYGNRVEYYGTELHRGMTSFLKKMLVAHS